MSVKLYSDSDGNNIVNTENPDLVKNSVNKNADYQSIKTFYLVTNEEPTDVLIEQSINNNFTEIDNLIIDYAINKDNFENINVGNQTQLDLSDKTFIFNNAIINDAWENINYINWGDIKSPWHGGKFLRVYRRVTIQNIKEYFKNKSDIYHNITTDGVIEEFVVEIDIRIKGSLLFKSKKSEQDIEKNQLMKGRSLVQNINKVLLFKGKDWQQNIKQGKI